MAKAPATPEAVLALRVRPGSRAVSLRRVSDGTVHIAVRERPIDGAATRAALGLLAEALGVAPSALYLLRGAASRHKLVRVGGLAAEAAAAALERYTATAGEE